MKNKVAALLCLAFIFAWSNVHAQVSGNLPTTDLSKNKVMASPAISADDITWQRDVFRMLDLKDDHNAPLYFPPQPDGQRKNLFSLLFENVALGQLKVYDYLDGKEVFTEEYQVKFNELLDRFWIPYEKMPDPKSPQDTLYKVETVDIPSNEVTLYYVKEIYFLDQRTSTVKRKVMCFCPVLVREDETGEVRRYPLFWVPFEEARNLLTTHSISTSSYNAASRMTIYDYFMRHQYKGDIYKVYNLQNQNIMNYCTTPEEIAAEQARLEKELEMMTNGLWEETHKDAVERENAEKEKENATKGKKKAKNN